MVDHVLIRPLGELHRFIEAGAWGSGGGGGGGGGGRATCWSTYLYGLSANFIVLSQWPGVGAGVEGVGLGCGGRGGWSMCKIQPRPAI